MICYTNTISKIICVFSILVLKLFATGWPAPIMALYLGAVLFHKAIMGLVPKQLQKLSRVEMVHMLVCSLLSLYTLVVLILGQIKVRKDTEIRESGLYELF